jgi:hypothetical protein
LMEERFHRHVTQRTSTRTSKDAENVEVFRETPLGIVLASDDLGMSHMVPVVQALLKVNARQVGASQLMPGHTALRDAVLNDFCKIEIWKMLLEALCLYPDGFEAFYLKDMSGVSLMEHLIAAARLDPSPQSLEMIHLYIRMLPVEHLKTANENSPLIFLLTTGNSYGIASEELDVPSSCFESEENTALKRVLEMTQLFLDSDPGLLSTRSRVSECTPMHAVLRNYGTYEPLIQELIKRDTSHQLMGCRNVYGDLPLHVACSVGVPLKVLKLVLKETAKLSFQGMDGLTPHALNPLIWSTNHSGYTPIDLEWVRVIESGSDFLTARTFYPLEATGVRRHCFKQDDYYKDLLQKAVDQVIHNSNSENGIESREEDARSIFGNSIDRISILIQSASYVGGTLDQLDSGEQAGLADVCKLCRVYIPSLPLPILQLFLWLRSEDILKKDTMGMIPFHHLLCGSKAASSCNVLNANLLKDWKSFVFTLLDRCPEQAQIRTCSGLLPLHLILEHNDYSRDLGVARHHVVEKLVHMFPESVDQPDPGSGLYPFMMAASDPNLSVDTVFCLLRRSPSQCMSNQS